MDNLTRDVIACGKAGFGVSYGKWKATQPIKEIPKPVANVGYETKACQNCGSEFVDGRGNRKYCCTACYLSYNARQTHERSKRKREAEKARNAEAVHT